MSQLPEWLCKKLESSGILYTDDQKLLEIMQKNVCQEMLVQEDFFCDTDWMTWINQYVPLAVIFSSF